MTRIESIPLETIRGEPASLGDFAGTVRLVVNVASQCGLTPQYEGLEALQVKYEQRGFCVLGFPSNDFGRQEPGSNAEIEQFCRTNFGVGFPMFSKLVVTGEGKHPLYRELIAARPETSVTGATFREALREHGITPTEAPEVLWNFEKFLVNRRGEVVLRLLPTVVPEDPELITAIEAELAR